MKISAVIFFVILQYLPFSQTLSSTESHFFDAPPGDYVEMKDHRLYSYCTGTGTPTVIFEAGIGGSSLEWFGIQQSLAEQVQTCAYDRGGYGWSDPGPSPRDSRQLVSEMREMLIKRDIPGPYILVGHSFGGYNVLYHAENFPEDTAGLVLIDSSHPQQAEIIPALVGGGQAFRTNNPIIKLDKEPLASKKLQQAAFLNKQRKAIFAQMFEIKSFVQSAEQARFLDLIRDIPLIVLTRSPDYEGADPELEKNWLALQKSFLKISNKSRHMIVPNSDHNIHIDYPELIVESISKVVEWIRESRLEN